MKLGWVWTGDFGDFSTYRSKPPYLRNGTRMDQGSIDHY